MRRVTDPFKHLFQKSGHSMSVVVSPRIGKSAALNMGDTFLSKDCSTIYLDADCVLLPRTLISIATALDIDRPRLAGPRICFVAPKGLVARGFTELWKQLPNMVEHVIGAGCYAVNPAGRARWPEFPTVTADDAFVRGQFLANEQCVVDQGGLFFVVPEGRALARAVRRWRTGNQELRLLERTYKPTSRPFETLSWLVLRPSLWRYFPAFAAVWLASHIVDDPNENISSWQPERMPAIRRK